MTTHNLWSNSFSQPSGNPRDSLKENPKERDQLARVFNTAMIASGAEADQDFSKRLQALVQTPAFTAILDSVKQLAESEGISEKEASEAIIATFKRLENIWKDYVYLEGVQKLKGPKF